MMSDLSAVAAQLANDYQSTDSPFEEDDLPEVRLLDEINEHHHLRVLTHWAMLDYNRNANRLADNILELWNEHRWLFFTGDVVRESVSTIADIFESVTMRYPNRDAKYWRENCRILYNKYGGHWRTLFTTYHDDALVVLDAVREDEFYILGGEKVGPFWLKCVDRDVRDLKGVDELPIPVDTHIRRLTRDLAGDVDDDEVRRLWRHACLDAGVSVSEVDTALWLVGNNWTDWGEAYWSMIT